MSGFNTKERNNNGEYEITFYTDNHEDFKKVQDLCRNLIGHGKPVSTEGDLISREALKDFAYINKGNFNTVEGIREWIDNAQAIPQVTVFTENADEKAVADLKSELQNVIGARPKGVWTTDEKGYFYCDKCGKYPHDQYATTDFCPKCGADMRKGDAE